MADVRQWTGFYRTADETGRTHLALAWMPAGATLCAATDDAPDLDTGIVEIAFPGQPWPDGTVCPSCAAIAAGPV